MIIRQLDEAAILQGIKGYIHSQCVDAELLKYQTFTEWVSTE